MNEVKKVYKGLIRIVFLILTLIIFIPTFAYTKQKDSDKDSQKRVVLKKNRVNGKNTLTQSMFNNPNTTYIIRRDFVLDKSIIIPANCTLEFKRGSISGGCISGTNTSIKYKSEIFKHVELSGSWNVPVIHSYMFSEKEEDNFLPNLFKLCNDNVDNTIIIDPGVYHLYTKRKGYTIPKIYSNTTLDIEGTIYIGSDNQDGGIGFVCTGNNIHVKGKGKIVGDRGTNTSDTEWSPVFFCNNCDSLLIEGVTIEDSYGDGVYCRYNCNNTTIKGVTFIRNRRCAIAFNSGRNNTITQCVFIDNGGRAPGCAIEFENDGKDMDIPIVNSLVINNFFKHNDRDIVLGAGNTYTDNVIIKGNKSDNSVKSFFSIPGMNSNYDIRNVTVEDNTVTGCFMFINACFKNKAIIRDNIIRTETEDAKTPCLNIKGNVLCENNTIVCPKRPAFENTYGGYYESSFDMINNKITAYNSILQLNNSLIEGNTFDLNHLMLFLYDKSECKENIINGIHPSGHLLYLGLSDSEFKDNSVDFNNTPNYGIKLVRKQGKSIMANNTYKNIEAGRTILESRNE